VGARRSAADQIGFRVVAANSGLSMQENRGVSVFVEHYGGQDQKPEMLSGLLGRHPCPTVSELKGVRAGARYNPPKRLLIALRQIPAAFRRRRVSPVAMVHPVVAVSPGVDMLAGLWVVSVSPVLAMRWFSFVHEGFKSSNRTKRVSADSEHPGSGMSMRKSMLILCGPPGQHAGTQKLDRERADTPELVRH
jgi:hypothetical protein